MSRLTRDEVRRVALLARLKLRDDELDRFTAQLGHVLEYVRVLDELDTRDVEPLAHAVGVTNVWRADQTAPSLPRDAALANAPQTDGRYFLVPPILD
jgi:aspartyl-tRNA(Asn)/glutamyl-tRNA(Gln) amidotransferase subunit C